MTKQHLNINQVARELVGLEFDDYTAIAFKSLMSAEELITLKKIVDVCKTRKTLSIFARKG